MKLKMKFAIFALLFFCGHAVFSQTKTIQGIVSDKTGLPISGVSVKVQGESGEAVTDFDGKYSINAATNNKLVFTFIGMSTQTVTVGSNTSINITLQDSSQDLKEVVVVAYGTQNRAKVTGAVSVVSSKDIVAVPITNAESALQGRAAGVSVVNGAPGSNPKVIIRGLSTMGNSTPLYVIDGVLTGNLSGLNPSDIESMTVLKDASTTALYGAKAFNGVIMVTTKKGKSGPGQLTFSSYVGSQTITKRYDVLNTQQYVKYAKDAFGSDLSARAAQFGNQTTDWQDEIFQTGIMQDYNLSFSNGTDTSTSRYSAGYQKQEGAVINTGFERYSFRANNSQKIGKLSVGSNIGLSFNTINPERNSGGRTLLEHAIKMAPYLPVYNANNPGGYQGQEGSDGGNDAENPVRVAKNGYQKINNLSIIGNIYAELQIYKGLKFRSQVSLDYYTSRDHTFVPSFSEGTNHQDYSTTNETNSGGQTIVFDNSLTYKTTIADKHNIEVLGVVTKNSGQSHQLVAGSRYAISNEVDQLRLQDANLSSTNSEGNNLGYIGRINYDYDDKYIAAVSARRDGSSIFGPNYRYAPFYSAAVGWNIAKESFMENSIFSTLKLRASTGTTGNDRIEPYSYASTLSANYTYPIGGAAATGVTAGRAANPKLKWESKTTNNIGLDFGLFDEKFTGTLEYYNNKASDILFAVPLPASVGSVSGTQYQNIADTKSSGYELTLGYNDREGDFTWSAVANLGTTKNEVTALAPGVTSVLGGPSGRAGLESFSRLEVGQPLFYFWGYQTNGIYKNQAEVDAVFGAGQTVIKPGDIKMVDRNGDKIINAEDKTNIGNPYPKLTYGLNLTAGYKKFDFNCFIAGVQGVDVFNANKFDLEAMQRLFNSGTEVMDRAIVTGGAVTNSSTTVPRALGAPINWNSASQRYVEDGSYARLKNVTVGYTFSGNEFQKYFSKVRFYLSAQNLVTITKYSGLDPEVASVDGNGNSAGIDTGRYPQPKSVIFGLEVTF
jgi:TonB-linked SusC/RagA family outer membrane protein